MIEGIKITKRFGNLTIFEDFNFKINDGDFLCFSGASGKGKTTLLNIIGLLEPFDSGKLLLTEWNIRQISKGVNISRLRWDFCFKILRGSA